jgi:hypothetical protein
VIGEKAEFEHSLSAKSSAASIVFSPVLCDAQMAAMVPLVRSADFDVFERCHLSEKKKSRAAPSVKDRCHLHRDLESITIDAAELLSLSLEIDSLHEGLDFNPQ